MTASFRSNWWDTHGMDDRPDRGTAIPKGSSLVGSSYCWTPVLGSYPYTVGASTIT
jgi:hypothetical protein